MKIWERYFFWQLIKSASLFLLFFYGLYILVDYASHLSGSNSHHSKMGINELAIHYLSEFSERADILLPFALLIGTVQTLTQMNLHSELVALLASGFSLHRLLRPFLLTGLAGVFLLYLNNELLLPKALKKISHLDSEHAKQKAKINKVTTAKALKFENGETLIYQDFDPIKKVFSDVYFLLSFDDVWHIETLDLFAEPPIGYFTDRFQSQDNILAYSGSSIRTEFPSLVFNEKQLSATLKTPNELSLSELMQDAYSESLALENEKIARSLTALYQKLALPWLALIAVIAPAPFCLRFSRQLPVFFIFAFCIFGLVGIYLIMDAAIILGERQVLLPSIAIFAPMGFFISLFLYRYLKIRT